MTAASIGRSAVSLSRLGECVQPIRVQLEFRQTMRVLLHFFSQRRKQVGMAIHFVDQVGYQLVPA
jgi:hypothetical protein